MDWQRRPALVTMAGGLIDSHLVETLLDRGAKVRAFVRYNSRGDIGLLSLLPGDKREALEIVAGDLRDPYTVNEACQGVTHVFLGLHSLDAPSSVDEFKFRMCYTAKPVRQRVVCHPWLAPLLNRISCIALRRLLAAIQRIPHWPRPRGCSASTWKESGHWMNKAGLSAWLTVERNCSKYRTETLNAEDACLFLPPVRSTQH